MNNLIITIILFFINYTYSQPDTLALRYFINNKELKTDNAKISIITHNDTLNIVPINGKFIPPRIDTSFVFIVKIENKKSYSIALSKFDFESYDEIFIGTVSEIEKFEKNFFGRFSYFIMGKNYLEIEELPKIGSKVEYIMLYRLKKIGTINNRMTIQNFYISNEKMN
jgi:hypothetical protein